MLPLLCIRIIDRIVGVYFMQVRTYSEWVIDGEYDWPPNCCKCNAVLEEGTDPQTTRLGCLRMFLIFINVNS